MAGIAFSSSKSVFQFCQVLSYPEELSCIIKEHKAVGLSDTETLENQLQESDYIPVLKAIWGEQDRPKRLEWLRAHAKQLHAPLLYELSIAEFTAAPSLKKVQEVSIPLIKAATFRLTQDATCSRDHAFSRKYQDECLEGIYGIRLDKQIQKLLQMSFMQCLTQDTSHLLKHWYAKLAETARLSLSISLPKPEWISEEGSIPMCSVAEYKEKRENFAKKCLEFQKTHA